MKGQKKHGTQLQLYRDHRLKSKKDQYSQCRSCYVWICARSFYFLDKTAISGCDKSSGIIDVLSYSNNYLHRNWTPVHKDKSWTDVQWHAVSMMVQSWKMCGYVCQYGVKFKFRTNDILCIRAISATQASVSVMSNKMIVF